jgi:hypothetical protein
MEKINFFQKLFQKVGSTNLHYDKIMHVKILMGFVCIKCGSSGIVLGLVLRLVRFKICPTCDLVHCH